jgi:isopentenyl-diphosphate Delta-isomerase
MSKESLEIVDENDAVIGTESREIIHKNGLLHREIHVWFYTPEGNMIFQHRAKDKDTYPDLLDATVGGHVEVDDSYEKSAIKETKEETGIDVQLEDLHFLKKIKIRSEDSVTGKTNYAFKTEYAYKFTGEISDLKVEEGKALGFESWPIDKMLNMDEENKKKFIPGIFSLEILELFRIIKGLI